MPKQTFFNLSDEKKNKIIRAAKNEFSRVPLPDASIQKIVNEAEIARGSFYQYFESKEDLMQYIVENVTENIMRKMIKKMKESNDIFITYIYMYDEIIKKTDNNETRNFCKMFFESVRPDDKMLENIKNNIIKKNLKNIQKIMKNNQLKYKDEKEIKIILRTINVLTIQAIARTVHSKKEEREQNRKDYLTELEIVKYGVKIA